MSNAKNLKKPPTSEKPVLQLTRYQVLLTVCALLVTMCIAFLTGQFLNAYQARTQLAPTGTDDGRQQPTGATGTREGSQISPRPVVLPPAPDKQAAQVVSVPAGDRSSAPTEVLAPAPRRDESSRPNTSVGGEAAAGGQTESTESPATSDAAQAEPLQPIQIAAVPSSVPPTPSSPPAGMPPVAPGPGPAPGSESAQPGPPVDVPVGPGSTEVPVGPYTIQVAAFDAKAPARAQEYKRRVAERSDYDVFLLLTSDKQYIRACIGSYPDRETAESARAELQKIAEFQGCFVRMVHE
jgi:hypothetical protein